MAEDEALLPVGGNALQFRLQTLPFAKIARSAQGLKIADHSQAATRYGNNMVSVKILDGKDALTVLAGGCVTAKRF